MTKPPKQPDVPEWVKAAALRYAETFVPLKQIETIKCDSEHMRSMLESARQLHKRYADDFVAGALCVLETKLANSTPTLPQSGAV